MGGSSYSDIAYISLRTARMASKGVTAFSHDADIKKGTAKAATHDRLNPKGVNRESRDSDVHPTSNAIAVLFDVTGSMGGIPRVLQAKLPKLMGVLNTKATIPHPQILFGAVGDVLSDKASLQIGQFESGVEMDEDIDKIFLEGNGGGHGKESYDLGLYFAAKHTSIDCLEKRNDKGYLFLIGDECGRDVSPDSVLKVFGDTLKEPITLEDIAKQAQAKYEVFFIIPEPQRMEPKYVENLKTFWQNLFGQNVLVIDDSNLICELIATTISLFEDSIDDVKDLAADLGLSKSDVTSLSTTLKNVKSGRSLKNKASVDGELATIGDDSVKTL